jgi:hypothetical protein
MVIFELECVANMIFPLTCYEHSVQRTLFVIKNPPSQRVKVGFLFVSNDNCSVLFGRINAAIKTITSTLYQKKGLNTMGGEYH